MRTDVLVAMFGVATIAAVTAFVSEREDRRPAGNEAEPPSTPSCIRHWGEARYRPFGFDHVVHVASSCARSAVCAVSTNVDPDPVRVVVPARSTIEVVTRVGSPAREFSPFLACRIENAAPGGGVRAATNEPR